MSQLELHRLLQRQLKKADIDINMLSPELMQFLHAINDSYLHFEDNRLLVERAMRLSSEELEVKNELLRQETEKQKVLIHSLKTAFKTLSTDNKELDDDDLLSVANQFSEAVEARKQLEHDLIKARQIAENSLETRKLFLANISHEIRTPLNAIMGMSGILDQSDLDEEQREYLDAIRSSSEGLLVIINDILDMTKMESGKFSLESIPFNLDHLLRPLLRAQGVKAQQKGIKLELARDLEVDNILVGDPTRLNQILANLLSNAIKFTEIGKVSLSIQLIHSQGPWQTIEFAVTDTGVGIDDSKMSTIFEEFSQEDTTITRKYGGTGLGLTIAKNLVEMMGGKLEVRSQKGVGSTFKFAIELSKGVLEIIKSGSDKSAINLNGAKVLLVEDNELNRLLAITLMKRWNTETFIAVNGHDAVEFLKTKSVDVILMDLQMPIQDGFVSTNRIRKELQLDTPIVALTANALESERLVCLEAGMNDYLSKPYRPEELYAKIARFVNMEKPDSPKDSSISFSLEKMQKMYSGNQEHVLKTTEIFLNQLEKDHEHLISLMGTLDFELIRGAAHKLKPSFDLFMITIAKDQAVALENAAEAKSESEVSVALLQMIQTVSEVITQLKTIQ